MEAPTPPMFAAWFRGYPAQAVIACTSRIHRPRLPSRIERAPVADVRATKRLDRDPAEVDGMARDLEGTVSPPLSAHRSHWPSSVNSLSGS